METCCSRLPSCLDARLLDCMEAARLPGCSAARLPGCPAARLPGCPAAHPPSCLAAHSPISLPRGQSDRSLGYVTLKWLRTRMWSGISTNSSVATVCSPCTQDVAVLFACGVACASVIVTYGCMYLFGMRCVLNHIS